MTMILQGGSYDKNPPAFELFARSVDKSKPVLFIDFAGTPDRYVPSYVNIVQLLCGLGVYCTRLCNDPSWFSEHDLSEIGGIFCAGGNTFRLMKTLRDCGAVEKIRDYLWNGGTWIGSSAGAIVGGADIMPIIYMDANAVLLKDTRGMDMMRGWSTVAHYGNANTDFKNEEWNRAVEELAQTYGKLIALSEETAIVVESDKAYVLGADCKVYENGVPRMLSGGERLYSD